MDQVISDYNKQRTELVAKDSSLRVDRRRAPLSAEEQEADLIIRRIRAEEAKSVWDADHPEIVHPFPGMEFLTGKPLVLKTKIYKLLSKMPKGALLHAHFDATVDPAWLLNEAYKYPEMHVRVPSSSVAPDSFDSMKHHFPLSHQSLARLLPQFAASPQEGQISSVGLTDTSYQPGSWVPLKVARESFPASFGGGNAFDRWILNSLTISPGEAYDTCNTVAKIWVKFLSTFRVCNGFVNYEPIFIDYLKEFLRSSVDDGISYIEVRINFWYKTMTRANGKKDMTHREMLSLVDKIVKEFKQRLAEEGREDDFLGLKVIYTTVRVITNEELDWYLDDCFNLAKEFPHLLAGFDLVGAENTGNPLTYYLERLLRFKKRQEEEGVEIPFIFHAGETEGDGTATDHNLFDAILLGTKRIGHGFSLIKHPELLKICRERDIALEVCPISNEILRLASSMPMHPLPALLNHGVPVALCSDDPAIFGNMGLSFDYFQVLVGSEISGLITLAEIAKDSIKHSLMTDEEKQHALDIYERKWREFVRFVIQEGGVSVNGVVKN